jgi:dihydroorotase-like cyclic amidohydrolase
LISRYPLADGYRVSQALPLAGADIPITDRILDVTGLTVLPGLVNAQVSCSEGSLGWHGRRCSS